MSFQDYELINTKRVNRMRSSVSIFRDRHFKASGGWESLYMGTLFASFGYWYASGSIEV